VPQDGKPARKVYSITDIGRQAFADELSAPLGEDVFRSPFLLLARFVSNLPQDLVVERANEQLTRLQEGRSKLDRVGSAEACSPADCWVLNYGRAVLDVAERYMRTHMHELIKLSRADQSKDAAE
jgi:PadR family transcriptional regulator AphA